MASLKDLRRRITSVKSTRKITKAMKMIAAVRLRKAQEKILSARPYAQKLQETITHLAKRVEGKPHPILTKKDEVKKVELLIITSDRGLCGGFNSNIIRLAERFRRENEERLDISLAVIGRKGVEYFNARGIPIRKQFTGVFEDLNFNKAREIAEDTVEEFLSGEFDEIHLVYNEFKSAISQEVISEVLLPLQPEKGSADSEETQGMGKVPLHAVGDYDYEPSKEELLDLILPRYVNTQVYRALLESVASEYGSRMTAMENATNNASEMIDDLNLQYNRARQAAITTELMEIIGGSEALKG